MPNFVAQRSITAAIQPGFAGMISRSAPWHIAHGLFTSFQTLTLTPTAANATVYTITIDGLSFSYTSDADGTVAEIVAGLVAAINAGQTGMVATNSTTFVTLTSVYADYVHVVTSTGAGTVAVAETVASAATLADGKFVCLDAVSYDDRKIRLPNAAGDITGGLLGLGVTLAKNVSSVRLANAATAPALIDCLRKGFVWVYTEEAVVEGAAVYVRYAAGGLGQGSFGGTTGTSERALLAGAVYRSAAAANALVEVELNLKA